MCLSIDFVFAAGENLEDRVSIYSFLGNVYMWLKYKFELLQSIKRCRHLHVARLSNVNKYQRTVLLSIDIVKKPQVTIDYFY